MHVPAAGWTKLSYNLGVAKILLGKGGLIETGRAAKGMWIITEQGSAVSESDLSRVLKEARSRVARSDGGEPASVPVEQPDPSVAPAWRTHLLNVLTAIPPAAFERLTQRLLREAGFIKVEVTGKSGDGGIDGVGVVRIQGLLSFHVHFQCKRYKDTVGSGAIRDFRGAMVGRSDKGLFITTGTFTAEAKKEATRDGAPPIDLIDGERLCDLLKELRLGVQTQMIEDVTIDAHWFDRI
jgi:restriction system protein